MKKNHKGKNNGKRDRPLYLFYGHHGGGHEEKQRLFLTPALRTSPSRLFSRQLLYHHHHGSVIPQQLTLHK